MSQNMLGVALRDARGPLGDLFDKLAGNDGDQWLRALGKMLRKENPWEADKVVEPGLPTFDVAHWEKVYDALGLAGKFDKLDLAPQPGLWTVPVLKGVTPNLVVTALRKLDVNFYLWADDLDRAVPKNDRDPARGSYVVHFCQYVEAEGEYKNLSANMLAERGVKGITLLERLLLELAYFMATGRHLDVQNVTLCSGSRSSGGGVPDVYWGADSRRVHVCWCGASGRRDFLRTREAVSAQ